MRTLRSVLVSLSIMSLLAGGVAACRCQPEAEPGAQPPTPQPATRAVPASQPEPVQLGKLAAPAAFDITVSSEGAVVAWAEAGACASSLRMQRLDADGRALGSSERKGVAGCIGSDVDPSSAQIVELALAADGGRLAAAWIAQDARAAVALGTHGADDAELLAPTQRISLADPTGSRTRGRLSITAAQSGQMRVSLRAPAIECVGEAGDCVQLVTQAFPPPSATAAGRAADTREVKTPCERMLVGAFFTSGIWYDAFCTLTGSSSDELLPLTQTYAIRPEISYAEAIPTLRGCEPLGLSPGPRGVVVWGQCDTGLRAQTIALEGGERVIDGATRSVTCARGRPLLHVEGQGGAISLALSEPRARLEQLLPEALAPAGARAVFTGRRLLVASVLDGALVLQRYGCRGEEIVPEGGALR